MKRKYISIIGIMIVAILLMNTALALCEDPDYKTNFLYINVSDDAYVCSNNPNNNYGSVNPIMSDGTRTAYFQFSLATVPEGVKIVKAYLRISPDYTPVNPSSTIYEVDSNNWDESTLTYNNRPLYGDEIVTIPTTIRYTYPDADVTSWVADRLNNSITDVSFASKSAGDCRWTTKEKVTYYVQARPKLIIEYANELNEGDPDIKYTIYNYANVTDVDTYNNVFYNANIGSFQPAFNGTEANTTYTYFGSDDANYHRLEDTTNAQRYMGFRFETKIDENVSKIQKIEILFKGNLSYYNQFNPQDMNFRAYIYDNNAPGYINENVDTRGNYSEYYERTYWGGPKTHNLEIGNNFDKYINEDGVLKVSIIYESVYTYKCFFDGYYYQVKVYYYDPPVVTPPVEDPPDDPGTPSNPVYPDLTDDTPIISVDGQYTGDLQNVLFRNLFQLNDKIGIPTWSLILLGGLIGVWKRRPELVIFCGLIFLFLLFFGYKLSMVAV
ncbi:MAG: hypothetical protein AMQ22_00946 [Candidatus Methanofastidiosum methylothiophilum]|uniref:Carbohydrate-binding module family 96 domain-containing protein n=1 Tax=Candidatus Methanofastidiosum methylothiophilum TaxID=1705564 RepID=A0A150J4L5_9EURY|nr:MAG: hypothetical protein AMQ22_00946 [Candidatus Methanofastidiosum methylthiophilus]